LNGAGWPESRGSRKINCLENLFEGVNLGFTLSNKQDVFHLFFLIVFNEQETIFYFPEYREVNAYRVEIRVRREIGVFRHHTIHIGRVGYDNLVPEDADIFIGVNISLITLDVIMEHF
jgi:hypothetical protein